MKTKILLTSMVVCSCISLQAQEVKNETKGNAIIQVFNNFHTGFGQDRDQRGFELSRSYLGYQYKIGKDITIKGVLDVGKSSDVSDYQRLAYIKNAMITWKTGGLKLSAGLISTTQFNMQEKAWGYRYIMKSFQDEYKFGNSADAGISAAYEFASWISADAIIVNGEGYKKLQVKDGLNYGLGLTLKPLKGFSIRLYGGLNEAAASGKKNTMNYAGYMGYKHNVFSLGAEFNYMKNAEFADGVNKYGFSVYASGNLSKSMTAFARYDNLTSDLTDGESALLVGMQFKLGSYVRLAPNFRMSMPKASGESNHYAAYINCYFGL